MASSRPTRARQKPHSAWTPASVRDAFERRPADLDRLARRLLRELPALVGRELLPWSGHYDRHTTSLAEDVVQDVMLKLFADDGRVLRVWDPERGLTLVGFLRRVVRFHVLQLFRSANKNPWRDRPYDEKTERPQISTSALLHQLWLWEVRDLLLEAEDERGRALYVGLYVEQQSADELAQAHAMTRDAVYQWRARFKRRASRLLQSTHRDGRGMP